MFQLAIIIGLYSYIIFILGIFHLLRKEIIIGSTVVYLLISLLLFSKHISDYKRLLKRYLMIIVSVYKKKRVLPIVFLSLLIIQTLVNLIGALGPELSYDALWYHLTLPKIYLAQNSIFHIPGGLFYYSDMPKLTEMFYIAAMAINKEILAKIIHFSFGILSLFALYKISRLFLPVLYSLISVIIFYSNLVVGWESITAYIDLTRTFYELMAVWGFLYFVKTNKIIWLIMSGVMLGFAVTTKLLSISSIIIFSTLLIITVSNLKSYIKNVLVLNFITFLVPLPWFIFSFINTGNPVYPFFTSLYQVQPILSLSTFLKDYWTLFVHSPDPISPIYLISIPLIIVKFRFFSKEIKITAFYMILSLFIWYLTPRTGGGRFILPYLPIFSLLVSAMIFKNKNNIIHFIMVSLIILLSIFSIGYRFVANNKYLPFIIGQEKKSEFLAKHLNFTYGDIYDTDGKLKNIIKNNQKVLIIGGHNLYYLDFPYIHESYAKPSDKYDYILVQYSTIPDKFSNWGLIYKNEITGVTLYNKNTK